MLLRFLMTVLNIHIALHSETDHIISYQYTLFQMKVCFILSVFV